MPNIMCHDDYAPLGAIVLPPWQTKVNFRHIFPIQLYGERPWKVDRSQPSWTARTGWSLRDDAEVVVDVEERRVAAEAAAQQGAVTVILPCAQVGNDRRIGVQVIAAGGAVTEALPVVQDGLHGGLGHEKNPDP